MVGARFGASGKKTGWGECSRLRTKWILNHSEYTLALPITSLSCPTSVRFVQPTRRHEWVTPGAEASWRNLVRITPPSSRDEAFVKIEAERRKGTADRSEARWVSSTNTFLRCTCCPRLRFLSDSFWEPSQNLRLPFRLPGFSSLE